MLLDITPILNGDTEVLPFEGEYMPDEEAYRDIVFSKPIHLNGTVTNMAGYMNLTLHAEYSYDAVCARCLAPIHRDCSLDLEKSVAAEGTLENEDTDDYLIARGKKLDLSEPVTDKVYLELPEKHLCKEDCAGLCPMCGRDLNQGACGCKTKSVDPRLEILRQLLDDPNHEK